MRHLGDSSSEGCEVECLAHHLEGDCGQERGSFRDKGVRVVNRPDSDGWYRLLLVAVWRGESLLKDGNTHMVPLGL